MRPSSKVSKTSPEVPTVTQEVAKVSPDVPKIKSPAPKVQKTPDIAPIPKIREVPEFPQIPRILDIPDASLKLPPWFRMVPAPTGNIKFIPFPIGRAPNEITRLYRIMQPIGSFLQKFGPLIGAAVNTALELVNAVQAYGMTVSGLAGKGFILTNEILSSQRLEDETVAMLAAYQNEEYQQLRYSNFFEMLQIAGGGSKEAKAALVSEASFMLGLVNMRLDEANGVYEYAQTVKQEANEKKKVAEGLVDSKEVTGLLTPFMGTMPRAQLLGAALDMGKISVLMDSVLSNTKALISLMENDKRNFETFSK
jgi:hypothetical protein